MSTVAAAACLLLAAASLAWPEGGLRRRRRRVLSLPPVTRRWARRPVALLSRVGGGRRTRVGAGPLPVLAGVAAAWLVGGPVAALVAGCYGGLAARAAAAATRRRQRDRDRAALLEGLAAAAADLRAGLAAGAALASIPAGSPDPLLPRVAAAVRLADRTGAPLAEILERIEADARGAGRARSAAGAQAAGAHATACLLAALPAGGIALGYAIGADPLQMLLRTPLGAGFATAALGLQLAGLAWTRHLARPVAAVTA